MRVGEKVSNFPSSDPHHNVDATTAAELALLWRKSYAAAGFGFAGMIQAKEVKHLQAMKKLWDTEVRPTFGCEDSFGLFVIAVTKGWAAAAKVMAKKTGWKDTLVPEVPSLPWLNYNFGHAVNWYLKQGADGAEEGHVEL